MEQKAIGRTGSILHKIGGFVADLGSSNRRIGGQLGIKWRQLAGQFVAGHIGRPDHHASGFQGLAGRGSFGLAVSNSGTGTATFGSAVSPAAKVQNLLSARLSAAVLESSSRPRKLAAQASRALGIDL